MAKGQEGPRIWGVDEIRLKEKTGADVIDGNVVEKPPVQKTGDKAENIEASKSNDVVIEPIPVAVSDNASKAEKIPLAIQDEPDGGNSIRNVEQPPNIYGLNEVPHKDEPVTGAGEVSEAGEIPLEATPEYKSGLFDASIKPNKRVRIDNVVVEQRPSPDPVVAAQVGETPLNAGKKNPVELVMQPVILPSREKSKNEVKVINIKAGTAESREEYAERKKSEAIEKNLLDTREKYAKASREAKKLEKDKSADAATRETKAKELEAIKQEYLGARRAEFERKALLHEQGVDKKIKNGEISEKEKLAELSKLNAMGMLSEAKLLYDTKTAQEIAEEPTSKVEKVWNAVYKITDPYRKLSLKKKLLISAGLFAVGTAGSGVALVAGSVAAASAAIRMGGSISTMSGVEALLKKATDVLGDKVFAREFNADLVANEIKRSMEQVKDGKVAGGLTDFLKSRDETLLDLSGKIGENRRKYEAISRYVRLGVAGGAGILVGSGATSHAMKALFEKFGDVTGLHPVNDLLKYGEHLRAHESAPAAVPSHAAVHPTIGEQGTVASHGAAAHSLDQKLIPHFETIANESRHVATIDKGGSVWKGLRSLVANGSITEQQFRHDWGTSTVEVHGMQVPVREVSQIYPGWQVVHVDDPTGGHVELVNYAHDKLGLGTNQDVYNMLTKAHKPIPHWLSDAMGHSKISAAIDHAQPVPAHTPGAVAHEMAVSHDVGHPTPEVTPPTHETPSPAWPENPAAPTAPMHEPGFQPFTPHPAEVIPPPDPAVEKFFGSGPLSMHTELDFLNHHAGSMSADSLRQLEDHIRNDQTDKFAYHYSLFDQEQAINETQRAMAGVSDPALKGWYRELLQNLTSSDSFHKSVESFREVVKDAGMNGREYDAVKNMKVGKLLGHHVGHSVKSWFMSSYAVADYEHPQTYVYQDHRFGWPTAEAVTVPGATPERIFHERELTDIIRHMLQEAPADYKGYTVDRFLKEMITPTS